MLKDPYDVVAEVREIKRQLSREAGNDVAKLAEMARKHAQEMGVVYSNRPAVNAPIIRQRLAEIETREAARKRKIDRYLAKRVARSAAAKSA